MPEALRLRIRAGQIKRLHAIPYSVPERKPCSRCHRYKPDWCFTPQASKLATGEVRMRLSGRCHVCQRIDKRAERAR